MLTTIALLAVPLAASSPADPVPRSTPPAGEVAWFRGSFSDAVEKATQEEKVVFIEFRTRWCQWCDELEKGALSDARVLEELEGAVSLCIDAERGEGVTLAERFGVERYPTLLVLSSTGKPEDKLGGYVRPAELLVGLRRVKSGEETVSWWEQRVRTAPDDLTARFELSEKLAAVGDRAGHKREVAHIKKADPEGRSLPMRMFALRALIDQPREEGEPFDATGLRAFLAEERYPRVLFHGWSALASQQTKADDHAGARESHRTAWRYCPEHLLARTGNVIAWSFWLKRDDLSPEDRAFALDVARKAAGASGGDTWVLDTLACCFFMNGHKDKAIETIRRVIQIEPEHEEWQKRLRMFLGEDE